MSTDKADRVKAALLKCAAKSEELEDAAKQLTAQKLRSQLCLESKLKMLDTQFKVAGQHLLSELARHHDQGQAKIHQQQLTVLKHNMALSSAMAKEEMVDEQLCWKVEEFMTPALKLPQAHFVPSSKFDDFSSCDIGFFQLGQFLPSQVVLSLSSVKTVSEQQVVTASISLDTLEGNEEVVENWQIFLDAMVERDEKTIDFELSEDNSDILNLKFVAKCDGRYSVSVNMYGEGVKGSPMVVEILGGSLCTGIEDDIKKGCMRVTDPGVTLNDKSGVPITEEIVGEEFKTETLQDINTLKGEAVVDDEEIISQNSLDCKSEICVDVPGEALVEEICVIEEVNIDNELDQETIANNTDVDNVEEPIAEAAGLKELSSLIVEKLDESLHPLPAIYSVGSHCLVRWCEDSVWYRARVDSLEEGLYEVTFVDYGNKVVVGLDNMVATAADIPSAEMEMVDYMVSRLSVGQSVIAKWSEDNTWYNGIIASVLDIGLQYSVLFVDYGNTEVVIEEHIVETFNDIPVEELENVDLCVNREGVLTASEENIIDIKDASADSLPAIVKESVMVLPACEEAATEVVNDSSKEEHKEWKFEVGSECIAEWSEDSTWYNCSVIMLNSDGSYQVHFHDYGNEATVLEDKMVTDVNEIPCGANIDELVKAEPVPLVSPGNIEQHDEKLGIVENRTNDGDAVEVSVTDDAKEAVVQVTENVDLKSPSKNTAWVPEVGSVCCAKWSDRVWYNARIDELLAGGKEVLVTFSDYGNTDKVPIKKLVQNRECIPKGAKVNTFVEEDVEVVVLREGLVVGDQCVALWAEDNIWYNAVIIKVDSQSRMVEVEFIDYGNVDLVAVDDVYRTFKDALRDRSSGEMTVDPNVETPDNVETESVLPESVPVHGDLDDGDNVMPTLPGEDPPALTGQVYEEPLLLKSLVRKDQNGKAVLNATVVTIIPCMDDVVSMAIVKGALVTVSTFMNYARMWNRDGGVIKSVVGDRPFHNPKDVVSLEGMGEGFAILDEQSIFVFDNDGQFVKTLVVDKLDTCKGMVVDSRGRLVVINKCMQGDLGKLTVEGETDILYIDLEKEKVVKRVEMIDILENKMKSDCKALAMYKDKLYVVDTGLDCIYTLFHEDGEDQAEVFGSPGRGEGQFSGVSSAVVDVEGTSVIADTRNNRLQVIDSEWEFIGFVKVQPTPLSRPANMCLDKMARQLVVLNKGSKEIVRYALGPV